VVGATCCYDADLHGKELPVPEWETWRAGVRDPPPVLLPTAGRRCSTILTHPFPNRHLQQWRKRGHFSFCESRNAIRKGVWTLKCQGHLIVKKRPERYVKSLLRLLIRWSHKNVITIRFTMKLRNKSKHSPGRRWWGQRGTGCWARELDSFGRLWFFCRRDRCSHRPARVIVSKNGYTAKLAGRNVRD